MATVAPHSVAAAPGPRRAAARPHPPTTASARRLGRGGGPAAARGAARTTCGTTRRCGRAGSSCCRTCWPPSTPTGRSTTSPTRWPGCSTEPPTYRQTRGEPRAALPLFQRAHAARRARLGDDHPDTLASANNLALDLYALGEYQQARASTRTPSPAAAGSSATTTPTPSPRPTTSPSTCARWASYQQARDLDEDTLTRRRRVLGDDHPDTLTSASNLAVDLRALGEYQQARDLDEDTLARRRRVLGDDHPDTLTSANNLAVDLSALGEHQQARALDEDTLARRRRVLGDDHPDTLTSANNLALDLRAGRVPAGPRPRRGHPHPPPRVLGDDHPDTLASANNLALDLRVGRVPAGPRPRRGHPHPPPPGPGRRPPRHPRLGQQPRPRPARAGRATSRPATLDEDTLARRRRVLGDDHPDTLTSANNLAADLAALGEHEQARALDEDTLTRRRRVLGDDHPDTLTSANNLAADLRALGEHEQARALESRSRRRRGATRMRRDHRDGDPRSGQARRWIVDVRAGDVLRIGVCPGPVRRPRTGRRRSARAERGPRRRRRRLDLQRTIRQLRLAKARRYRRPDGMCRSDLHGPGGPPVDG